MHPFAANTPRDESVSSNGSSSHRRNPTGGYVVGSSGMLTSKSSASDTRSRKETPLQSQLPLEDIRRQVVKFINYEDGSTRSVNVSALTSGVEVLERALKKFGKWNTGASVSTDGESDEDGDRLEVDGWGVYADSEPEPNGMYLGLTCADCSQTAIRGELARYLPGTS